MSPEREKTLRSRASEMEASRMRRPYYDHNYQHSFANSYHRSFGSPDVFAAERLRNSTMLPLTTEEKLNESQLQTDRSVLLQSGKKAIPLESGDNLLRSELMGDSNEIHNADPDCKDRLFGSVRACLADFRKLESKRKNLSMRFDFCLTEIFNQIDSGKTGYLTLNNLDDWAKRSGILMNREDWALILDRYDRDKDSF